MRLSNSSNIFEFLARLFGRRRPPAEDPEALARFQQLRERSVPPTDKKNGRSDLLTRVREHEVQTNLIVRPRIPAGEDCEADRRPGKGTDMMAEVKRANRDVSGRKGF